MTAQEASGRPRRFEEQNVPGALQGLVTRVLRSGLVLGGILLGAGLLLDSATGSRDLMSLAGPATGSGIASLLEHGGAPALVLLGMLVVIVTPLARVVISVALFASGRDRQFTLITLFVLAMLGATITVGVLR